MTDQPTLRDRIEAAIDEVFARWEAGLGDQRPQDAIRDAVLAVLPAPVDRATEADTIGLCGYCGVPRESHHHGYVSTAVALAAAPGHITATERAAVEMAADRATCDCEAEVHMGVGIYHHPWCATKRGATPADREAILAEAIARVEDPEERAKTTVGGGLGWEAARDVLRHMANEAQQPETDIAAADNPTPLRWGLNDVLWGDDDTVTVLLSGPAGEPYWLELDPERAAVLRQDLAGPEAQQPEEEFDYPRDPDAELILNSLPHDAQRRIRAQLAAEAAERPTP